KQICEFKHEMYKRIVEHQTPQVKLYRTLETSFFALFELGTTNRALILLLIVTIAAITTTLANHHISIRPARYVKDYRLGSLAMAVASSLLLFSSVSYYRILADSGSVVEHAIHHYLWMILFTSILLISLKRLVFPPATAEVGGSWGLAGLAVP